MLICKKSGMGGGIEILKGGLSGVVEGGGNSKKNGTGKGGKGQMGRDPENFCQDGGGGGREK